MTNYKVQIIIVTTQDKMWFGHPQLCFCCFFVSRPFQLYLALKLCLVPFGAYCVCDTQSTDLPSNNFLWLHV